MIVPPSRLEEGRGKRTRLEDENYVSDRRILPPGGGRGKKKEERKKISAENYALPVRASFPRCLTQFPVERHASLDDLLHDRQPADARCKRGRWNGTITRPPLRARELALSR